MIEVKLDYDAWLAYNEGHFNSPSLNSFFEKVIVVAKNGEVSLVLTMEGVPKFRLRFDHSTSSLVVEPY